MYNKFYTHRKVLIPGTVFLLALTIRLVYCVQVVSTPLMYGLAADSAHYEQIALQMLDGVFKDNAALFLNPLYPSFLAAVYRSIGHHNEAVIFIQAMLDATSCVLIYYCTRVFFNRQAALLASVGYALYGLAIFYSGLLLAPPLIIFFLLSSLSLVLYAIQHRLQLGIFFQACFLGLQQPVRPAPFLHSLQ